MSAADFLDNQMGDDEVREAWRNGDLVSSSYPKGRFLIDEAPSRDTRVLRWLVANLGAEVLLAMVAATSGGSLGERTRRAEARRRIEELA